VRGRIAERRPAAGVLASSAALLLSACGGALRGAESAAALADAATAEFGTVRYAFESTIEQGPAVLRVTGEGLVEADGDLHQVISVRYDLGVDETALGERDSAW
jgi:hypothetical protein